ncbi:hypothetical protein PAMP_021321 [Pampus punctatissimus]
MGTWRGLRVAFLVGSLFMILLIIVYWDDVGGFNLYPLQDPKHKSLHSDSLPQTTTADHSRSSTTSPSTVPSTNISNMMLALKEKGGAAEEEEGKEIQQERKEEAKEDEDKESSHAYVDNSEQEARKQRIMDVCSGKDTVEFPGRTRAFEQIPNRELDHLIVDDTHQIIYCYVPKLQHYTKFLFVRDPFVRLISAFRNKFGRPNEDFYRQFGSVMLRRYGNVSGSLPETAAEAFAAGIKPTFQQFITYLLDPETERESIFNEHWRQIYRLCHPCQVKYDFIGRLETLEPDAEHLLKLLEVDHLLRFPSGARNQTAASWEKDWFAQIPIAMRRELYKLYGPDFELFGYPKPDSVLHQ